MDKVNCHREKKNSNYATDLNKKYRSHKTQNPTSEKKKEKKKIPQALSTNN